MSSFSTSEEPAAAAGGSFAVTMPETGSQEGVMVREWFRRPGERIETGEPLCLVAWDGNVAELESPGTGVVRMLAVDTGRKVPAGTTLARIETPPEPAPAPVPELPDPELEPALVRNAPVAPAPPVEMGAFLSPAVKRFAAEHGLDPAEVSGTGRDGRVSLADVRTAHLSG